MGKISEGGARGLAHEIFMYLGIWSQIRGKDNYLLHNSKNELFAPFVFRMPSSLNSLISGLVGEAYSYTYAMFIRMHSLVSFITKTIIFVVTYHAPT